MKNPINVFQVLLFGIVVFGWCFVFLIKVIEFWDNGRMHRALRRMIWTDFHSALRSSGRLFVIDSINFKSEYYFLFCELDSEMQSIARSHWASDERRIGLATEKLVAGLVSRLQRVLDNYSLGDIPQSFIIALPGTINSWLASACPGCRVRVERIDYSQQHGVAVSLSSCRQ